MNGKIALFACDGTLDLTLYVPRLPEPDEKVRVQAVLGARGRCDRQRRRRPHDSRPSRAGADPGGGRRWNAVDPDRVARLMTAVERLRVVA